MIKSYDACLDEELMGLIVEHNNELAFATLYRRHVKLLMHTAIRKTGSKATEEDLVQETFVNLWLNRKKILVQKNIQAYLNGMLRNNIITFYYSEIFGRIFP